MPPTLTLHQGESSRQFKPGELKQATRQAIDAVKDLERALPPTDRLRPILTLLASYLENRVP
jgi:hypothetical protein